MPGDLTYEEARDHIEKILIKGSLYKADVFITRSGDTRFVVKDFSKKGFWERNLVGRFVIGREARAYRGLAGIDGVPGRFKRLSAYSFAVEFLDGENLGALERGQISSDVIRQFERIVGELHERGWVHLDLHRRSNILLVGGKVYVVDLASALHPGGIPLFGRILTSLIGLADRLSLLKMKTIFAPDLLNEGDKRLLKIRNAVMPSKWNVN